MPRLLNWPRSVNAMIVGLGLALILITSGPGWIPQAGSRGVVTIRKTGTVTTTRTVERRVHGKVVTRNEKVYVQVPLVVIHTEHRTIRVRQHLLPLHSVGATVANPLVTMYVQVPTTIYLPTTVYSTVTSTDTVPTTITSTITLPLVPTS